MATVKGKTPAGRWSGVQALTWSVLQGDTWYLIEELGCPGGSTSATVSGTKLLRGVISAVASTTALVAGRLSARGVVIGAASSTVTALARLALRALATMSGAGSATATGLTEHFVTGQPGIVYQTSGALDVPAYAATSDAITSLTYGTKQS